MAKICEVIVETRDAELPGTLCVPPHVQGTVLFAHGGGSSRFSPRNQLVAEHLQNSGLATLMFDLLTEAEGQADQRTHELRFDIPLLSRRLVGALDWLIAQPFERLAASGRRWGLFGASTGAAAALIAAAERPGEISAVVSRGGRPDLAGEYLRDVIAATLLIVGSKDSAVIALNEQAARQLHCHRQLTIVPGATHLFEEPGALEQVAQLAGRWFLDNLHY